jgi:hypothetical protein
MEKISSLSLTATSKLHLAPNKQLIGEVSPKDRVFEGVLKNLIEKLADASPKNINMKNSVSTRELIHYQLAVQNYTLKVELVSKVAESANATIRRLAQSGQ